MIIATDTDTPSRVVSALQNVITPVETVTL
jgi:hypothetical protein